MPMWNQIRFAALAFLCIAGQETLASGSEPPKLAGCEVVRAEVSETAERQCEGTISDRESLEKCARKLMGDLVMQGENEVLPTASVIAIVAPSIKPVVIALGQRDNRTPGEIKSATARFQLGSISKMFTAISVMHLAEKRRLSLDEDITGYLDVPDVPRIRLEPALARPITLRHLLTHTAGLEVNDFAHFVTLDPEQANPLAVSLAAHPPMRVREPGLDPRNSAYSNWGAALAGRIVEIQSGQSFPEFAWEEIFKKLGMNHSTFAEPLDAAGESERVRGHDESGESAGEPLPREFWGAIGPAGSGMTTGDDMASFMDAILASGTPGSVFNTIISDASLREMQSRLVAAHPKTNAVGMGFIESSYNCEHVVGHIGATLQGAAHLALLPERKVGIFVAANSRLANANLRYVIEYLLEDYFPTPVSLPSYVPESLAAYAGRYRTLGHSSTTFEKAELLFGPRNMIRVAEVSDGLKIDGFGKSRWLPVGADAFQKAIDYDVVAFLRDRSGAVTHFSDATGVGSYEKVEWYSDSRIHKAILQFGVVLLFGASFFISFLTSPRTATAAPDEVRLAWGRNPDILLALAGFSATFGAITLWRAFDDPHFAYSVPLQMWASLSAFTLFGALGATIIVRTAANWLRPRWSASRRAWYSAVSLMIALIIGVLLDYNLIGFQTG